MLFEALIKETKYTCHYCNGKGQVYEDRNLHESGGLVSCTHCKNGVISKEQEREWHFAQIKYHKNAIKKLKK